MTHIWFHYVDFTKNHDDYAVTNWDVAKQEAAFIVNNDIHFVINAEIKSKIIELLDGEDWQKAVDLFNEHNAMKCHLLMREGKPVYS